jgi:hypothetical protein
MTVSELMEKLSQYPKDMEVQIVVDFPPEVVVELVDMAMEQGGKPFTLAAYPSPDLRVERCACEDADHKLVSIDVCGLCLAGLENEGMGEDEQVYLSHVKGTD